MTYDCTLRTHHSVEFVRKGRRVVERAAFRLDVPVSLQEKSKTDLPVALVYRDGHGRRTLHGHDGGMWRPAPNADPKLWVFEGLLEGKVLQIGSHIHDQMPRGRLPDKDAKPQEPFDPEGLRIVSDDIDVRTAIAIDAARRTMVVDGQLWMRVREPQWLVRKDAWFNTDLKLLADVQSDWQSYRTKGGMRFALDRLPEALEWAVIQRGGKPRGAARRSREETAQDIVAGPWGITHVDLSFVRGGDFTEYAREHLKRVITVCADVIESVPEPLRRRWEELRIMHDSIGGSAGPEAARTGLSLVGDTLDMLMKVRDLPDDRRKTLLRDVSSLLLRDRRSTLIEGIVPSAGNAPIDEADLAGFVP